MTDETTIPMLPEGDCDEAIGDDPDCPLHQHPDQLEDEPAFGFLRD